MRRGAWMLLVLASMWSTETWAGDYFLDGSQKMDLLLYGRMTGHDETLYDVWIVPGYVPPAHNARKGWQKAGDRLKAYGRASHYRRLEKTSRAWLRFARRDLLRDFALRGTRDAWGDAFSVAGERVERRVFGWWFAYPWALIEATTESVLRTGIGIPGSLGTAVGAYSVVPAWYFAAPAVASAGYAAVPGTALPVVAAGWNTVIAPPLALAGQQPAPERADGFWMKRLKDPSEDDLRARVVAWQSQWQQAPTLVAQRETLAASTKHHEERMTALRAQIAVETKAHQQALAAFEVERRRVVAEKTLAEAPALRAELAGHGYTAARLQAQRPLLQALLVQQGMTDAEAVRLLDTLMGADLLSPSQRGDAEKTDPLLQIKDRL
jgi:hypothetical protein